MAIGRRRLRSGRLPASCAKSGTLFRFFWFGGGRDSRFRNKSKVELRARTGKELKRLAARTAGAMEEMVMVVTCVGRGIRSGELATVGRTV